MNHILQPHIKHIQALNLEGDSACNYDTKRWSKLIEEAKSVVRKFEGADISRQSVIDSFANYYKKGGDYLEPFILTMIWGFDTNGYGTYRTNKYLHEENRQFVKQGIDLMGQGNSKEAFSMFLNIKGLNMSYISKLLYFGTRGAKDKNYLLVFDFRVARSLTQLYVPTEVASLLGVFPSVNFDVYIRYCNLLHKWAREIRVEAEQIELFLFDGKFAK
jgi:hypothetical protein